MSRPNTTFDDDTLDVLRGVPEIARFVRKTERQTYHGLQSGHIPAIREGALWVTTKTRLRRHYNGEDVSPAPEAAEGAIRPAALEAPPLAARLERVMLDRTSTLAAVELVPPTILPGDHLDTLVDKANGNYRAASERAMESVRFARGNWHRLPAHERQSRPWPLGRLV